MLKCLLDDLHNPRPIPAPFTCDARAHLLVSRRKNYPEVLASSQPEVRGVLASNEAEGAPAFEPLASRFASALEPPDATPTVAERDTADT
mmetsp:Transcript_2405/g.5433  ORF Transcript_2405/g.5433 Transcript_2405/m.5433 type:complete len:90 (+) Transcript_2405:277-546(+)